MDFQCSRAGIPYECPDCETQMTHKNIIGWGYKAGRPVFYLSCPACFEKCYNHVPVDVDPEDFVASVMERRQ